MPQHGIVFFDGVCNLCNGFVNYIIRHDKKDHFRFAPLQSSTAAQLLKPFGLSPSLQDGVILFENNKLYFRSGAALRIAKRLSGPVKLAFALIIIPPFIRNAVYDFVARKRYGWFGRRESCVIPEENVKDRFI